jgi:hypothetical protein
VRSLRLALALPLALAACGGQATSTSAPEVLRSGDLSGWKAVRVAPGIGGLAPDLSGLAVTARADAPTLVHAGDAVRATTLVFGAPADAAEALDRAGRASYVAFLRHVFRTEPVPAAGRGYRMQAPRQAEAGSDMVELYLLRSGRTLAVVELVSGPGFAARVRERLLALVRSRLS